MLYIALVLDEKSQKFLKGKTMRLINGFDGINDYKLFCHHMTVAFHTMFDENILNYLKANDGKCYNIVATHLGISDKAIALKVETDCPSYNKIKHITLATINGGKPKDSNNIVDWCELKNGFTLSGKLIGIE